MMKKMIVMSFLSLCVLLTSCSMMQNDNSDNMVPEGGDPAVTEPANHAASNNQEQLLPENDAKKIVLDKVPGAQETDIREWKLDRDDGRQEYEGKLVYENTEYEFEMNAATGEFISWESESVLE